MASEVTWRPFKDMFEKSLRNGLMRPKKVRGSGVKMVNMGELFSHSRIGDIEMERVPLSDKEAKKYLLQPGDLLFARQSLVHSGAGQCSIFLGASEPVTFESHLIRARLDPKMADPLFYFYFFGSDFGRKVMESIVEQVAAAGIRQSDLKRLKVPYIPVDKQHAIVHILGSLDDKIELNRRMNATLEGIARALFKSWFVDFDPVYARRGERESTLPPEVLALFPAEFEESELGPIPRGWEIRPLDKIAHYQNGMAWKRYAAEEDAEDYLSVIKIREMRMDGFDEKSDRTVIDIKPSCKVYDGDVLFSWSGSLLVDIWTGGDGALNQHLFKVTSKQYPKWFYYHWTKEYLERFQRIAAAKATTMGHIRRRDLKAAKVLIPPKPLLHAMGEMMEPLLEKLINNRLESRTLAELRDTLLPRLISGKLRVPDTIIENKE